MPGTRWSPVLKTVPDALPAATVFRTAAVILAEVKQQGMTKPVRLLLVKFLSGVIQVKLAPPVLRIVRRELAFLTVPMGAALRRRDTFHNAQVFHALLRKDVICQMKRAQVVRRIADHVDAAVRFRIMRRFARGQIKR